MQRTQIIFIDHENVRETELTRISGKPAKVFIILGARSKTLPVQLFLFAQDHPGQVRIIQTPVEGPNALDFVLTCELGRQLAAEPDAYFHIVSKDNDFKSVVRHLKDEKRLIARHPSLADIPALWTARESIEKLKVQLADSSTSRPSTRKTLANKIKSAFGNPGDPETIENAIADIVQSGILSFTDENKISYTAA